jgi:hypothetical protein
MKKNQPRSAYRWTPANELKTEKLIEKYRVKAALLQEWETFPSDVQILHRKYLQKLREDVRRLKGYLLHRASVDINL